MLLQNIFQKYSINLPNSVVNKFLKYYDILGTWNKKINLSSDISNQSQSFFFERHIVDSLILYNKIIKDTHAIDEIFDIGSGQGLPGIILKIAYPDLNITLVEINKKKYSFLKYINSVLGIKCNIINTDYNKLNAQSNKSQLYVFRGVAPMDKIISSISINKGITTVVFSSKKYDNNSYQYNVENIAYTMQGKFRYFTIITTRDV